MINSFSRHPVSSWLLLVCLAVFALYESRQNLTIWQYNAMIKQPQTIPDNYSEFPAPVVFAKAYFLHEQGDFQQALRAYAQIEHSGNQAFQSRVSYNMGTVYLQEAAKLWHAKGVWEYNQISTLLDLAEASFKKVLMADPGNWPARYNLEYTLRIRPPAKNDDENFDKRQRSSVHAIMPGIPGGGP